MIPRMQLQILTNVGRIILSLASFAFFSPRFRLEAFLSSFLMTSFTSLSVTPLVCNAGFKLNHRTVHKNSASCYQLTTKINRKKVDKNLHGRDGPGDFKLNVLAEI